MNGRHILLDVMGTLVYDPFFREVPAYFRLSLEDLYKAKDRQAWIDFETGERDEDWLVRNFFLDRRSFDHRGLKQLLRDSYRFLPGVEELLLELSGQGASLHLFSNYPVWYREIEQKLTLSRYAPWTIVSCETGLRKPDIRAYQNACRLLDVAPEHCLFVDDRAKNCRGAETAGMSSHQFRDAEGLRRALVGLGQLN